MWRRLQPSPYFTLLCLASPAYLRAQALHLILRHNEFGDYDKDRCPLWMGKRSQFDMECSSTTKENQETPQLVVQRGHSEACWIETSPPI